MIHKKGLNYFRSKGLLPFQAEVAIKFLESKDKPYWQLVSPVGTGKIHVAAVIALEGAALEYVDECISYDLPLNPNVFEQRWVRFLRVGRKSEFRMVILKDQSKALPWEEELSKVLENTMACNEESN